MVDRLFNKPQVMLLSAGVLGLLGLVPGMPNLVFLLFTALLLGLAWRLKGRLDAPSLVRPCAQLSPPPADAVVTSVSWHIESERPLPSGVRLAICLGGGGYFFPYGLAGRNLALGGQLADNPAMLWLKLPGRGAVVPPVRLLRYRLLVNYRSARARAGRRRYTLNLGQSNACALACPLGSYILLRLRCSVMEDKPC